MSGQVGSGKGGSQGQEYKRGDLVWAKVRGYSWWPARIGDVLRDKSDRKYRVDFIGDNTHQTVPHDKVADFADNYASNSVTKKKDLLDSIEIAKKQMRKEDLQALERRLAKVDRRASEKGAVLESKPESARKSTNKAAKAEPDPAREIKFEAPGEKAPVKQLAPRVQAAAAKGTKSVEPPVAKKRETKAAIK